MKGLIIIGLCMLLVGCEEPNYKLLTVTTNLPECYIAEIDSCALGYDSIDMLGATTSKFIQCCNKPHYILQGIDVDLINHYMKENTWSQSIFDDYNCSFDISRKLHCSDPMECYDREDLRGCHMGEKYWCCDNQCLI